MSDSITPEAREPSRSQLKRDDQALIVMARELAELSPAQIQQLPLTEQIITALREAAAMPPRSARKRQIKFIGGLMRKIDVSAVKQQLLLLRNQSAHASREQQQIEQWRQRLLADDKQALTEFLVQYQNADRQHLKQLISSAKKEIKTDKPPKFSRQLFRYLRTLITYHSDSAKE